MFNRSCLNFYLLYYRPSTFIFHSTFTPQPSLNPTSHPYLSPLPLIPTSHPFHSPLPLTPQPSLLTLTPSTHPYLSPLPSPLNPISHPYLSPLPHTFNPFLTPSTHPYLSSLPLFSSAAVPGFDPRTSELCHRHRQGGRVTGRGGGQRGPN